jgi:alpha-ketoglutarate-dependent taurine dioxygenase
VGPFEHDDPGHRADPSFPHLFKTATKIFELSPHCGTELQGVQLTDLNDAALDELALLTAQRGCVVFRAQKFAEVGFEEQKRIAAYFGPLHKHGWMPHPQNGPVEHVIVYDSREDLRIRKGWARKSPIQFHVDQSPEAQPPGMTFFCMLVGLRRSPCSWQSTDQATRRAHQEREETRSSQTCTARSSACHRRSGSVLKDFKLFIRLSIRCCVKCATMATWP